MPTVREESSPAVTAAENVIDSNTSDSLSLHERGLVGVGASPVHDPGLEASGPIAGDEHRDMLTEGELLMLR